MRIKKALFSNVIWLSDVRHCNKDTWEKSTTRVKIYFDLWFQRFHPRISCLHFFFLVYTKVLNSEEDTMTQRKWEKGTERTSIYLQNIPSALFPLIRPHLLNFEHQLAIKLEYMNALIYRWSHNHHDAIISQKPHSKDCCIWIKPTKGRVLKINMWKLIIKRKA